MAKHIIFSLVCSLLLPHRPALDIGGSGGWLHSWIILSLKFVIMSAFLNVSKTFG